MSRELGHTSPAMVQRVYAHLDTIRHRAEVVEYRVEQYCDHDGVTHRNDITPRSEVLAG